MLYNFNVSIRFAFLSVGILALFQTALISSLFGQEKAEIIQCDVTILRVPPEVAQTDLNWANDHTSGQNGVEVITEDKPSIAGRSVEIETSTKQTVAVKSRLVSYERYLQMLHAVRNTKGCSVVSGPIIKTIAGETAKGFAGKAIPYLTSAEESTTKFGTVVNVPEHQIIEDGVIVEHQVNSIENGIIHLNSKITINEITNLETYSFEGANRPIALYLPSTRAKQLSISAALKQDEVLIIPSSYIENKVVQRGVPFLSNTPYVSRLFKNVGVNQDSSLSFYVISATRSPE